MLANMPYTTGMINGNKANNQYNSIQVNTTMKTLTTDQKYILNKLSAEIKAAALIVEMYSNEDRRYTLDYLASDLQHIKKQTQVLEDYVVNLAFEAVNNQKQEA